METDRAQQITRQAEVMANTAIADYYAKQVNAAIETWQRKAGRPLTPAEVLAVGIQTMFANREKLNKR